MGVLSAITGDNVPFKWTNMEQRAFERVKQYVQACRDHCRVPLIYGGTAPHVWLMTDACINGVATVIAQGDDWKTANVAAFFSAKLSTAQQNYLVHEQEMLTGVEGMLQYRDILQGVQLTDHKGLIHLYQQKNLLGRQARWIEKISEYDFEIQYLPGVDNILPDALSRLYSNNVPDTVHAPSEYVQHAEVGVDMGLIEVVSMPLLVGLEAGGPNDAPRHSIRVAAKMPGGTNQPSVARTPQQRQRGKPSRPLPIAGRGIALANPHPDVDRRSRPSRKCLTGQQPNHAQVQVGDSIDPGARMEAHTQRVVPPAEQTWRVKGQFVLRGPRERTEGGETTNKSSTTQTGSRTAPQSVSASNEVRLPTYQMRTQHQYP